MKKKSALFFKNIMLGFLLCSNIPASFSKEYKNNNQILADKPNTYLIAESNEIKTILVEGFGIDFQDAAQNAAKNALLQVVGSFIDSETMFKEEAKINDGILSHSKVDFREDIKQYSQGSIKSLKILETIKDNDTYRVTARVEIKLQDFKRYIRELAYGSTGVSVDLWARASIEDNNKSSMHDLLYEKILKPIRKGEVYNIEVGSPQSLKDHQTKGWCENRQNSYHCRQNGRYANWKTNSSFIFPVKIKLKSNFIRNIENILDNISDKKTEIYTKKSPIYTYRNQGSDKQHYFLTIIDRKANKQTIYRLNGLNEYWLNSNNISSNDYQRDQYYWWNVYRTSKGDTEYFNPIRIKLLDENNSVLQARRFSVGNSLSNSKPYNIVEWGNSYLLYNPESDKVDLSYMPYLSLFRGGNQRENVIFTEAEYMIAIEFDLGTLKKVKRIEFEFIEQ